MCRPTTASFFSFDINAYYDGDSFIHKASPAVKVIVALIWSVHVAQLSTLSATLLALVASIALLLCTRIALKGVMKRLLIVNVFIFFIWLMVPFSMSGEGTILFSPFSFLHVTEEGVLLASLVTLKANSIVIASLAILGTTSIYQLAASLKTLKVPEKFIVLLVLTVRYFYVIFDEYYRLREAMKIRGFKAVGLRWHTYTTLGNLIGMLLLRSLQRSDRIYNAMLCRGYHGTFHLAELPLIFKRNELMLTAFVVIMVAATWVV